MLEHDWSKCPVIRTLEQLKVDIAGSPVWSVGIEFKYAVAVGKRMDVKIDLPGTIDPHTLGRANAFWIVVAGLPPAPFDRARQTGWKSSRSKTRLCLVQDESMLNFVSQKSEESNLLKISGEPRRTRTSNPLIKSQLLYH